MAVTRSPRPPADETGFRFILGQPAFRLIWFAQLASQLADKFLMFSLIILAYHLSGGSTPVAITLLSYTLPAVVIAPLAGVFADRHDRKRIMVGTNFLRGLLVATIPISALVPALRHDFVHLLAITFVFSAVGQFFSPAEAAAIPSVVPRRALIAANSLVLMTMVVTLLVGGPLAPVVSRLNIYAPYWWATALYVLAGLLIVLARIPPLPEKPPHVRRHPFHQLAAEMKEGWDALRSSPVLLLSFYQLSLAVLVLFMMFTLAPAYVSTVIGIEAQDSYLILVPATIGAIASAIVLGQFGRRLDRAQLLVGALLLTGLTLIVLAAAPAAMRSVAELRQQTRIFAGAFSALLGLEFGALMIPAATYLMEHTRDRVRGRVFALLYMVINGVTALPVLAAAALSDTLGTGRVIGGLGVLLAAAGVLIAGRARSAFAESER